MHLSNFTKFFSMLFVLLPVVLSLTSCGGSGYTIITGQYVSISPDCDYIISESEDGSENIIRLYIAPDTGVDFSELTTGDIINAKIVLIQTDGALPYTDVFDYTKEKDGAETDIAADTLNEVYQLNTLFEERS